MQPAADMMRKSLKNIKFNNPVTDVISNVTANPVMIDFLEWIEILFRSIY